MARNWKDVRVEAIATGRINEARVAALQRQMLAEVRAHRLAELREAYGLNQANVAQRLGVSQSRVSRLERGDMDHTELATIRAYVVALGGELEIVAKFGDERITVG
jgi:predicted transcriptional regulator